MPSHQVVSKRSRMHILRKGHLDTSLNLDWEADAMIIRF